MKYSLEFAASPKKSAAIVSSSPKVDEAYASATAGTEFWYSVCPPEAFTANVYRASLCAKSVVA